jgi:hypothetical protein
MWYWWSDRMSFDVWHVAACSALDIPRPGRNAATGEIEKDAQWTTAYTEPVEQDGAVWAVVEPDVAVLVPDGLGVPGEGPRYPDEFVEVLP